MDDLCVTGQLFGTRLVSSEKEQELRDRDAELQQLLERLQRLRPLARLPLVSTGCTCQTKWLRPESRSPTSEASAESEESDDEYSEGDECRFTLEQVLHAITLYEKKPLNKRSPKTLRNLVCSYNGKQDVGEDDVTTILDLCNAEDPGIGEAALLLIRQLGMREQNAFRFLSRDCMKYALSLLDDVKLGHLHEVAAQVVGKLACHVTLGDYWLDYMMTDGLAILKMRMSRHNPQNVRYACAQTLVPLATHRNLAILILDQVTDVINTIRDINSDFKEVYAELMTVLAQHTDHTRESILNINSLTEALDMLKKGPCASQRQALVLVATLAESECGLKALLEDQALHYVLSAIQDSECRQVRCTALAALHNALAIPHPTFQKQVLVNVDQFFHEHEEGYGLNAMLASEVDGRPKFRLDTESRMSRAIEDLCKMTIKIIHKEARLTKDKKGKVCTVHVAPGIDLDPTLLKTLTHLVQVMIQLGHLKVTPVKVKGFDLEGDYGKEFQRIMRRSFGGVNPVIMKTLIEQGATCILDILHAYTMRLHLVANIPVPCLQRMDPENIKDHAKAIIGHAHTAASAWTATTNDQNLEDISRIFSTEEFKLIQTLLELSHMLAVCSCDNDLQDFERDIKDKMKGDEGNPVKNMKQNHNHKKHMCSTNTKTVSSDSEHKVFFTRRDSGVFWDEDEDCIEKKQLSVHNTCECNRVGSRSRPDSHLKEFMDRKASIQKHLIDSDSSEDESDIVSEEGLLFKEHLNKEMHLQRRAIRVKLFESGIIESVGPWLGCMNLTIKSLVLPILRCIIQHVTEFIEPRPEVPVPAASTVKMRPMSAMTSKERDRALNLALYQMSPGMNSVIKDALGMPQSPPTSPRKTAAQPPSPQIFTIAESQSHPKQRWPNMVQEEADQGVDMIEDEENFDKIIGATKATEDNSDLFYEDDDPNEDNDSIISGSMFRQEEEIPPVRQCLTVPQWAHDQINNGDLAKKNKLLKTYSHEDYGQFARKQTRPQSGRPPQNRPMSAKVAVTTKSRPQSAKVTVVAKDRPSSAPRTVVKAKPPGSEKGTLGKENQQLSVKVLPRPKRPQSARMSQPQSARVGNSKATVRIRPQSAMSSRGGQKPLPEAQGHNHSHHLPYQQQHNSHHHIPKPPNQAKPPPGSLRSKSLDSICPLSARRQPYKLTNSTSQDALSVVSTQGSSAQSKHGQVTAQPPVVKLQVTANIKPGGGYQPFTLVGTRPPSATHRGRPTSASSSKVNKQQKALEEMTRKMKQGQLPWKPTFDKCEPVRSQCCHRVVEVCGRLLIRDLLSRDLTARRAAIVFLQEVIKQSETSVHMKLSECSLIPRLVDYLRVNDENLLEEVLGLVVARLLVSSDQRLKQLFSRCGGTELLMSMASSSTSCGFLRTEVASTLKAITKANGFQNSRPSPGLRRTMSAPVVRTLTNDQPDIWDKIMDRWKEEDKVSALLRKSHRH